MAGYRRKRPDAERTLCYLEQRGEPRSRWMTPEDVIEAIVNAPAERLGFTARGGV